MKWRGSAQVRREKAMAPGGGVYTVRQAGGGVLHFYTVRERPRVSTRS